MYILVDENNVIVACSSSAINKTNEGYLVDGVLYIENELAAYATNYATTDCVQKKCFCKTQANCIHENCPYYNECCVNGETTGVYTNKRYGEVCSAEGKQLIVDELKSIKPTLDVSSHDTFPTIADTIDTMFDDATVNKLNLGEGVIAYNGNGQVTGESEVIEKYDELPDAEVWRIGNVIKCRGSIYICEVTDDEVTYNLTVYGTGVGSYTIKHAATGEIVTDKVKFGEEYIYEFTAIDGATPIGVQINDTYYTRFLGDLDITDTTVTGSFVATGDTDIGCDCNYGMLGVKFSEAGSGTVSINDLQNTTGTTVFTEDGSTGAALFIGKTYYVTVTANDGYAPNGDWVNAVRMECDLTYNKYEGIPLWAVYTVVDETETSATIEFTAGGYHTITVDLVKSVKKYNNIKVHLENVTYPDDGYYRLNGGEWVALTKSGVILNNVEKLEVYGDNNDVCGVYIYDSNGSQVKSIDWLGGVEDPTDVTPYLQDGYVVEVCPGD